MNTMLCRLYTRRHLFQPINEHKHSYTFKHLLDFHNLKNKDLHDQFTILKKCRRKLDILIDEMLFIKNKQPTLYTQSDSIKAKPFYLTVPPRLECYFILFSLNNHMH